MNALEQFKQSVNPGKTHLRRLPKIILVFGSGPVGVEPEYRNSSFRNAFLNWAFESGYALRDQLQLPEYFPDEWNRFDGYQNLVDFEREAGAICGAILLFSEGAGALAELGVFCMDSVLSERLLVVIRQSHFNEKSFLVNGPLRKLRGDQSDASVCVVEAETVEQFYSEAANVGEALQMKVDSNPRKELISAGRVRDQLLLIADLIELFGAATETEILGLLEFFGFNMPRAEFRRLANQLKLFGLINEAQQYTTKYLIAPTKNRDSYIDYDSAHADLKFDRTRFKTETFRELKKDTPRRKAYEQIHGKVPHGTD